MAPAAGQGGTRHGPQTIVLLEDCADLDDGQSYKFSFKRLFQFMGPGILMSIAYVDPGNLESDLQVGAQAGYVLLWLLLWSTVMGLIVQMQAAKLGVVTGRHLAQHCRRQYPTVPRIALWLMAEIAIIGSDVQEVIGSAIALSLLSGGRLPLWAGVLLTAADSFALLFIERLGIRVLEGFFGGMVGIMVATFGVMYARADVPTSEVVRGFMVPSLPRKDLPVAVALMGSLIMPHNIYLHSALVQTRQLGSDRPAAKREAMTYFGIESALSLVVAVVINLFITAVFARGFYGADLPDIGLQTAGRYLGETYGPAVVYIWALGLLAAGQSSTMTGTYTGQFVMGGFLDLKVSPWARVAITRAVAIAPTLAVALLCSGDGSQLDQLNQALNLLQSIQLPFALVPVLTFTSSRAIMGEFANGPATVATCWGIAGLVVLINMMAVYEVAYEAVVADPWVSGSILAVVIALYLALIGYLALGPQSQLADWLGWGSGPKGAGTAREEEEAEALLAQAADEEAGTGPERRRVEAACGCCAACQCWAVSGAACGCGGGTGDGACGGRKEAAGKRNGEKACACSTTDGAEVCSGCAKATAVAVAAAVAGNLGGAGGKAAADGSAAVVAAAAKEEINGHNGRPATATVTANGRRGGQRRRPQGAGGGAGDANDDLDQPLLLEEDEVGEGKQ